MKKLFLTLFCICLSVANQAVADETQDFYGPIVTPEELINAGIEKQASQAAANLLEEKMRPLEIDEKIMPKKDTSENNKISQKALPAAPFGLLWGATVADTKNQGVILTPVDQKDYVNNYIAKDLPRPVDEFIEVIITFGKENELWRMFASGKKYKDSANAAEVLKQYRQYYTLLTQKYGNAQQFFTPKIVDYEETIEKNVNNQIVKEIITKQREEPIGNDNFLAQLQTGEAELYATFSNNEVGAALAVNVDGNNQSYLTIEYKNLKIFEKKAQELINSL